MTLNAQWRDAKRCFANHGAVHSPSCLSRDDLAAVEQAIGRGRPKTAGVRLAGLSDLSALLSATGKIGLHAAVLLGPAAFPVRAVMFDKGQDNNWSLAWHQDRTVVVRRRVDTVGYGPWSLKASLHHVAPPFEVLAGMATLRVHLDAVDEDNAPLLIVPGSHRLGRLPEGAIPAVVDRLGVVACLAQRGDIWAYATPIVHASKAASRLSSRRVLQLDYAARPLDGKLEWLGV